MASLPYPRNLSGGALVSSAPTKLPLHPPTARDFCVFCVFRGTILRNLNICVHLCHLWEDYLGLPHAPTQGVQLSQLHQPSCHCIFPQNSQNFLAEENFCVFCVFRGTILRNLNICAICGRIIKWVAWVWQGCHTLLSVFCGRTRTLNFCGFRAFCGENTHPLGGKHKEGMAECHALLR